MHDPGHPISGEYEVTQRQLTPKDSEAGHKA